ncbi:MAG TPA: zf-HC2 domain-containing protein [Candidatus Aquicultor sp.]|jgi:hypothetical protein
MDCTKARKLLAAYYDNRLDSADKQELETHLASCTRCSEVLAALTGLPHLLRGISVENLPKTTKRHIVRRSSLHDRTTNEAARTKQPMLPAWAIAVAIILVSAMLVITPLMITGRLSLVATHVKDVFNISQGSQHASVQGNKTKKHAEPEKPVFPKPFIYLPDPQVRIGTEHKTKETIEQAAIQPIVVQFSQDFRIVEANAYRDQVINQLLLQASSLGLNAGTLRQAVLTAAASVKKPAVPSFAEHAVLNGHNAWVIVLNWESGKPGTALSRIAVYAIDESTSKIVESWPQPTLLDMYAQGENPHKTLFCRDCHPNFDNTPKRFSSVDWRRTAKTACTKCHDHKKQFAKYKTSIHGKLALANKPGKDGIPAPTCADCHSGHTTLALKNNPGKQAEMHRMAKAICGRCHEKYWQSYNDYYHGKGYKAGAQDAPACWDCHGYHDIQPLTNTRSHVASVQLPSTCKKCHEGSDSNFAAYAKLIHGYNKELQSTFIMRYLTAITGLLGSEPETASMSSKKHSAKPEGTR